MKKVKFIVLCILISSWAFGQSPYWTQKANFGGTSRSYACAFAIGHYVFVGGSSVSNDFWKYDERNNTWTSIASYPGSGSAGLVAFAINGKGYVGLGENSGPSYTDLWSYDTTTNSWTQLASFPGTARYACFCFVIGNSAYVGCGDPGSPPYLQDMYQYNAITNNWTAKSNFPGGNDAGMVGFAIGKNGYAGSGGNGSGTDYKTFWEYDTTSDAWTSIASIPSPANSLDHDVAFTIGTAGYVGTGRNTSSQDYRDFWKYDTVTKAWSSVLTLPGVSRSIAVAAATSDHGYIGTGYMDSVFGNLNDFWQFTANLTAINELSPTVESSVKVYPNPSNGILHVTYSNLQNTETMVEITDMMGRYITGMTLQGHDGTTTLNVSNLDNGIYFYRAVGEGNNTSIANGKIILAK